MHYIYIYIYNNKGDLPIPIPILRLLLLIFVESTRTQWRAQRDLVLGQALDDDRRYALIGTVVRAGILDVLVGECRHGPERLVHGDDAFVRGHVVILRLQADDRRRYDSSSR